MREKNFEKWNYLKKSLDTLNTDKIFFYEKEVWFCSIGVNVGSEQDSRNKKYSRPVLVLKKCNRHTFIGIPLTSKKSNPPERISIKLNDKPSVAIISQVRLFDRNRMLRKYRTVDSKELNKIKEALKIYLKL